jgi:hypothetical protein
MLCHSWSRDGCAGENELDAGEVGVFSLQFVELFIILCQYILMFKLNMRFCMTANQLYSIYSALKMTAIHSSETAVNL